jgi:hypothetical protein
MTINGQSQPEEIFQQYKTKYIKHSKDHVRFSQYFNSKGSGSSESVSIDDGR